MRKPRLVEEHEAAGKRIVVDGQHIFVREEGEGEPVLLLHGVPSSSFLYRKMLPELAGQGFRAVSFDFPGVGLSDKPKDLDYGWHSLAKWVGRVVDALELPPVHLVLHDIAGPIGGEWAIQNPVKVRSITITNTPLERNPQRSSNDSMRDLRLWSSSAAKRLNQVYAALSITASFDD